MARPSKGGRVFRRFDCQAYHAMIRCQGLQAACRRAPPEVAQIDALRCAARPIGLFLQQSGAEGWVMRIERKLTLRWPRSDG